MRSQTLARTHTHTHEKKEGPANTPNAVERVLKQDEESKQTNERKGANKSRQRPTHRKYIANAAYNYTRQKETEAAPKRQKKKRPESLYAMWH